MVCSQVGRAEFRVDEITMLALLQNYLTAWKNTNPVNDN